MHQMKSRSLDMQRTARALTAGLVLLALGSTLSAAVPAIPLPGGTLAQARAGFTPEQARDFRKRYSPEALISAGDVALFHFIDIGLWMETVIAARSGDVMPLVASLDPAIGKTRVGSAGGGLPLLAYLRSDKSRAQGMIGATSAFNCWKIGTIGSSGFNWIIGIVLSGETGAGCLAHAGQGCCYLGCRGNRIAMPAAAAASGGAPSRLLPFTVRPDVEA